MAGFYLKKILVDIIVEKGTKEKEKKLIENVDVKVFTRPTHPGIKPVAFLFV